MCIWLAFIIRISPLRVKFHHLHYEHTKIATWVVLRQQIKYPTNEYMLTE